MENRLEMKIKKRLEDLEKAQKRVEKYYAHQFEPGKKIIFHNIYDCGLAFDERDRAHIYFLLALAEAYPGKFKREHVAFLERERDRLTRRIRAWQNRQIPGTREN